MALTEKNVSERISFELLYNIQNKIIKEDNKELNTVGKHQIKLVVDNFNDNNNGKEKIKQINNEINDAKKIIENYIKETIENFVKLSELEKKVEDIKLSAKEFEGNSKKLRKATWCSNFKWNIVLIFVIILLFLIILPISIKLGKN